MSKKITTDEIKLACEMLKKFCDEFEMIYGRGAMTMNLHLLNHFHEMILNCGPLWCYNLFPFENNIGKLKEFVCGHTDVLKQIAMKYSRSRNSECATNERLNTTNYIEAYGPIKIILKQEHISIFEVNGCSIDVQIWARAKKNGIIFTSKNYKQTKSVDFFVELEDGQIGAVEFYFGEKLMPKLLLEVYEKTYRNFHWTEVKSTQSHEIHPIKSIKQKILFLKAGTIEYITNEPDMYGAFFC